MILGVNNLVNIPNIQGGQEGGGAKSVPIRWVLYHRRINK